MGGSGSRENGNGNKTGTIWFKTRATSYSEEESQPKKFRDQDSDRG